MKRTLKWILLGAVCAGAPCMQRVHASEDVIVRNGGKIIIHNNVVLKSGDFKVEAGGTVAIDLGGKVTATGNIIYGGTINVDATGGGTLARGKVYTLFQGAGYPGTVGTLTLPTLTSPLLWKTSDLPLNGSISIFAPPPPPPPTPDFSISGGGTQPNIGGTSTFTIDDPNAVWNFGDGTSATGGTVTHVYTIPGTYQVTVTVLDANGDPVTQTLTVTVGATPFRISSARIKYAEAGDTLNLRGIASINTAIANQTVVVTLGGVTQTFQLNAKGTGVSGDDLLSVRLKRTGRGAKEAILTLLLKGSLANDLKTGSTLDANGFPAQIPVVIQINGSYIGSSLKVKFKANRRGATGTKIR